jgi:hypothetical protein
VKSEKKIGEPKEVLQPDAAAEVPFHSSPFALHSSEAEPRRDLPDRTFAFARRIVLLCRELDQAPGVSRTLAHQLLRSGCSVGANVEEGQGSQSRADFIATIGCDFSQHPASRRRPKSAN